MRPDLLFCCGEPRPGFQKLWDVILGAGVEYRSYCTGDVDGHDLVTDVPFTIEPFELYCHGAPLIHLEASPAEGDRWGFFRYHHAQLYRSGMLALNPIEDFGLGLNQVDLVNLIVDLYAYPGEPPATWDHLELGTDHGVYWAYKRMDHEGSKIDAFVFRGSVTSYDWLKDALALAATPEDHPGLGPLHPGFFLGIPETVGKIAKLQRPDAKQVFLGHSLGAGQACQAVGLICTAS